MTGEVVELASWCRGAIVVSAVLDDAGLVAEVRSALAPGAVCAGTIKVGAQRFPLEGTMPIPVPRPNRFAPDAPLDVTFSGRA